MWHNLNETLCYASHHNYGEVWENNNGDDVLMGKVVHHYWPTACKTSAVVR